MAHRRTSKRKTSRKPKKVRRNVRVSVPDPRPAPTPQVQAWVERTFAPGTPVMLKQDFGPVRSASGRERLMVGIGGDMLSAGTRGVVDVLQIEGSDITIWFKIVDARDPWGGRLDSLIGKTFSVFNTEAIEPLVDNWLQFQPQKRYAAPRPRKTTSRRVRPNTIPPPPTGQHDLRDWVSKTFAPGTAVRLKKTAWATLYGDPTQDAAESAKLPVGTVGAVSHVTYGGRSVQVEGDFHVPLFTSSSVYRFKTDFDYDVVAEYLEPLDDNWGPLVRPLKPKYRLPKPRKTTSRRVRSNTIPPPPAHGRGSVAFCEWLRKTFTKGTRVQFLREHWAEQPTVQDQARLIPSGSVGTVVGVGQHCEFVSVEVWLEEPLFTSSTRRSYTVFVDARDIRTAYYGDDDDSIYGKDTGWGVIKPLDDNWGPLVVPAKRTSKKPQPGWQKQLARSRRIRTMRPNATCPSCGSPHYFESMWHRDCATPTCEYFRGGKISGASKEPEPEHAPADKRSILVTYSTMTPTDDENGDYEQEHGEKFERDIDPAVDLDEDETFAEYAAKFIENELGYVDDNGDGTYYQSEYHVLDYGTGEQEQLAAHLHPPEAWADDLDEIHRLLKQRKLVS